MKRFKSITLAVMTMAAFMVLASSCKDDDPVPTTLDFENNTPAAFNPGLNESNINVGGAATEITKIVVNLTILHQSTDDLVIKIESPQGTVVTLSDKNRGTTGDNFTDTTFDDAAATAIGGGASPFTGSFRPDELLSGFNGEDANGLWKLIIEDLAINGSAVRELSNWSITVTGTS